MVLAYMAGTFWGIIFGPAILYFLFRHKFRLVRIEPFRWVCTSCKAAHTELEFDSSDENVIALAAEQHMLQFHGKKNAS